MSLAAALRPRCSEASLHCSPRCSHSHTLLTLAHTLVAALLTLAHTLVSRRDAQSRQWRGSARRSSACAASLALGADATRLDAHNTTTRLGRTCSRGARARGAVSCAGSELRGAARRPSLARAARRRAVVAGGAAVARPTRKSRTLEFDQEGLIVGMMLFLFVGPTE